MLSGGMAGWFFEPIRVNPTKVSKPKLAPKGACLGFYTFFVFWGQWYDCLPFFCCLYLPITRGRYMYKLVLPSTRGPKIWSIPGPNSIFLPGFKKTSTNINACIGFKMINQYLEELT